MSGDGVTSDRPQGPLDRVLARQRARGHLGPSPVEELRSHSRGFASAVGSSPARALDLGSGGGVPGLVLAEDCWPDTRLTLLDASRRRCTSLELAVADLGLVGRVEVRWGRAEEVGHEPALRGTMDAVVVRSFAGPGPTAECGAPFLRVGGVLVVSDPPGDGPPRWHRDGLSLLGLEPEPGLVVTGATFTRLRQVKPCPTDYPRRVGLPRRRPLF